MVTTIRKLCLVLLTLIACVGCYEDRGLYEELECTWPPGPVPIVFGEGITETTLRQAAQGWGKGQLLVLGKVATSTSVTVWDNMIYVRKSAGTMDMVSGQVTGPNNARLQVKNGRIKSVVITVHEDTLRVHRHELGHALGLAHDVGIGVMDAAGKGGLKPTASDLALVASARCAD